MTRLLVTGDYVSVKAWERRIPSKGVAVQGARLFEDGTYLGKVCRPLTYVIEPDGDSLRIYYTPTEAGA